MKIAIKDIFEKHNITLSRFASDFALSRNTAMQYIRMYEEGEMIPKEKYRFAFERLFNNYDSNMFEIDYYYFKRIIARDKMCGTFELSMGKTDRIMSMFKKLNLLFQNDTIDDISLFIIDMILGNYSTDTVFKTLCEYMYFFNHSNLEKYNNLPYEEKVIYTNYFKIFTMQKQGLLKLDEEIEKLFLARINEINKLKALSEKK